MYEKWKLKQQRQVPATKGSSWQAPHFAVLWLSSRDIGWGTTSLAVLFPIYKKSILFLPGMLWE